MGELPVGTLFMDGDGGMAGKVGMEGIND